MTDRADGPRSFRLRSRPAGTSGGYRPSWLRDDAVAAVALTALLVPAGMAYAQAAGLPPESGLYATIVPLVVYAFVGPSPVLVLGPDSSLAPLIAASVLPLAAGDPERAVALAGLLGVLMGLLLVVGGLARAGFVADLLSRPIRIGYLNGIAIVVIVGQLPLLLGQPAEGATVVARLRDVIELLTEGEVNGRSAVIGLASLAVLFAAGRVDRRVPAAALVVVGALTATVLLGWQDDVAVVGSLPGGLPSSALGGLRWSDVTDLLGPAVGVALIAFADSGVLSRSLAARRGVAVDTNTEMAAIGVANLGTGLLGGFPVSASSTRTAVAEHAGSHSQVTALASAALVVVLLVAAPAATSALPVAALAAVVVVAAARLIDVHGVVWLLRVNRTDGLLCLAATTGVVFIGVLEGIVIAAALSMIAFVSGSWRPYRAELGHVVGVRGYHDLTRHPEAQRIPEIVIVRFDAPLFFANAGIFGHFVRSTVERAGPRTRVVVLAAEPITDIDTTGFEELERVDDYLRSKGAELVIAELKGPVKDQLERYDAGGRFGPQRLMPTVGAAVDRITGRLRTDLAPPEPPHDATG